MLRPLALVALSASLASGCADEPGPATTNSASTPYTPRAELAKFEVSTAPTTCPAVPTLGAEATAAQRRLSPYAASTPSERSCGCFRRRPRARRRPGDQRQRRAQHMESRRRRDDADPLAGPRARGQHRR